MRPFSDSSKVTKMGYSLRFDLREPSDLDWEMVAHKFNDKKHWPVQSK